MFLVILTRQMRTRFYTYFLLFFFAIISVVNAKNDRGILHIKNYEKSLIHTEKNQYSNDSEIRTHNHNSRSIDHHINNCKYTALLPDHFHYKIDLVETDAEIEELDSNSSTSELANAVNFSKLYLIFLRELYANNSHSYQENLHLNNLLDTLFIVYRVIRL